MIQPKPSGSKQMIPMGLLVSVCLLFPAPRTRQEPCGPAPIVISVAQKLLRALYPEIAEKNYVMSVASYGTFDRDWTYMPPFEVDVGSAEKGHIDLVGGRYRKPAQMVERKSTLAASFEFEPDGFLADFHVRSDTVTFSSKSDEMRARVDAHPGWSDQQVTVAMEEAGARFGPTQHDAVLKTVPVKTLEPFIGALQIDSAEFRLRHRQPPQAIAELYWAVLGRSQIASGRQFQWDLIIEPFHGRLVRLSRSE